MFKTTWTNPNFYPTTSCPCSPLHYTSRTRLKRGPRLASSLNVQQGWATNRQPQTSAQATGQPKRSSNQWLGDGLCGSIFLAPRNMQTEISTMRARTRISSETSVHHQSKELQDGRKKTPWRAGEEHSGYQKQRQSPETSEEGAQPDCMSWHLSFHMPTLPMVEPQHTGSTLSKISRDGGHMIGGPQALL